MKNTLSTIVSFTVLTLSACSQQQLPDFPTLNNAPVATELRLVSAPERLVAGAWGRVVAEVRDQFDQPMPGQTVSVAVQISDAVIGLVPALGNTCTTGLAGEPCPVILRSEGQMGQYHLLLSSGALPIVALDIAVDPAPDTAHLYINMPGRPVFEFINGRQDGLVFQQPLALPLGQQGLQVKLTLLDQFGNPIVAMIAAELLRAAPAALPDAGPAADAGRDAAVNDAAPNDAAVNDAAPNDAAPNDAAPNDAAVNDAAPNDAAPSDAAPNDAAPNDAAPNDAAPNDAAPSDAAPSDTAPNDAAPSDIAVNDADRVALSLAGCGGQLSDRAEAMPNSDGELVLCLRGLELGAARIALSVPGILRVENAQSSQSEQIILRSQTVSVGGHRLQIPGQPVLTCDVGGALEQALTLRVIDRADPPNPVPGVEVETGHQGMESVAPRIAISGADGSLRINGQCPALRRVETQIMAWIKDDPNEAIMQPVEVQVGAVAQMRASLENSAPFDLWAMRIGEPRNLHIELFDEAANSVPQGEVSFSLLQAFRGLVRLDADACGATAGTSLHGLTCQADGAGRLVIALRAAGTLPGVPVPLLLRGHHQGGLDPQLNLPLSLETGAPVSLSVSPAGQLIALVGSGDADSIRARIADAGGNPVAGVAVSLRELLRQNGEVERHPDPAVSLDLAGDGLSDGRGEVIWHIAQISRASALQSAGHELEFSSILSNGPAQQTLWVSTSVGSATALVLHDNRDVVVPAVDGAWQLHGDAGSALAQRYTLSLVNARGAPVQQGLGLALTLRSEPAAGCDALAGLAAARFVQGQIQFGGQQIPLSFGTAARSCRYLLKVGSVEHELLLLQRTGQPSGGIFESNIGSVEAPIWRQIPDDGRLQPRPGFSLHPQAQPFDQRHDIRLRNPSDAFGNALLGAAPGQPGRVLQPAPLNAWIWPQVPVLRALPGGATVLQFSVMAGGTFNSDALLIASSLRGWDSPPQLRFTSQQSAPVIGEIRLRGIDRKVFPYSGVVVTHGRVRTNGLNSVAIDRFAGSDQLYQPNPDNCSGCAAENPNDGLHRFLSAENRHQAQLLEVRFWYVDEAVFEQVDQYGRCIGEACSRAVLHWTRDPRGPLQPPQRIGRYPLIRGTAAFDGLVRTYFQTLIPIADMSGGGAFSVAIESDAGEGRLLTSAGKPIFAPLRPLFRPRPLEVLAPPPPDGLLARYAAAGRLQENFRGFARILDVHRIQADNDSDEELLICGDDAFGGWIAIAQVSESRAAHGANPFGSAGTVQALRTFYSPGYRDESFNGEPAQRFLMPTQRFVTGEAGRPSGCAFVADGPGGALVMSFGVPARPGVPGAGEVIATPWRNNLLGQPQRLELPGVPGVGVPATELGWGDWQAGEQSHRGLIVAFGERDYGFSATLGADQIVLASAEPAVLADSAYAAAADDIALSMFDLGDAQASGNCGIWGCEYPTSPGLGGDPLEVYRTPGRLIGATDWGGVQGQIRFWRHTPRLAWYRLRSFEPDCRAESGQMVCPEPNCGDGQLGYNEVCERGPGCTPSCQLEGYEGERPVAGLAVSFAPMQLQDDADPAAEVIISQALAAAPVGMKSTEGVGLYARYSAINYGLSWGSWYSSRAACRRLGGDLPSERQWEGIASGGHGGFEDGPRPQSWGSTPRSFASLYYGSNNRIASTWLGVTPEGLADLTAHAIAYGEWTLADNSGKPSGMNAQNGPTAGNHGATWKGGGVNNRTAFPVRARHLHDLNHSADNLGVARCVWLASRP